jgi:predicted GNAT family N-acyltransferase/phosphoribosyl-ATP pyrophosphohydrolase
MKIERFVMSNKELADAVFSVRRKVFVEEQKVEEREEFDQFESTSMHYAAVVDGNVVGTGRWRITDQGIKLERFAVLATHRNRGVGAAILTKVLEDLAFPGQQIYLHAQTTALFFYRRFGFEQMGAQFVECNIAHFKMVLVPSENKHMKIQDAIACVREFHDAFGIKNSASPIARLSERDFRLRHRLMKEENEEYLEAAERGDLVEVADALGDMLYILCGTVLKHGLQNKFEAVFKEIQRSNMSKLDENGQPIYREDGKVLKSSLYFKPDIKGIVNN